MTNPLLAALVISSYLLCHPLLAQELGWRLVDPACFPEGYEVLECSSHGNLVFHEPGKPPDDPDCSTLYRGVEAPEPIPPEAPADSNRWFPCDKGDCLSASVPDSPWIAIVDWFDFHGLGVAGFFHEVARSGPDQTPPISGSTTWRVPASRSSMSRALSATRMR